jgi:hypothetical protein
MMLNQMESDDAGDKSRCSLDDGFWDGGQGSARAASDGFA